MPDAPKFRRRKDARPGEILEAALLVFGEKGFAAARLDEIARRAGVSKGALYLYFETKEDLFAAVVTQAIVPDLGRARGSGETTRPFPDFVRTFFRGTLAAIGQGRIAPIAKIVIAESRTFPHLARHWHDQVVRPMLGFLAGEVEAAQKRGEVRAGDPWLYAFQIAGPIMLGALWTETFVPIGADTIDFDRLIDQHVTALSEGLLVAGDAP